MSNPVAAPAAHYADHLRTLERRYADALSACGYERVVIFAGTPIMRHRDDQAYPFTPEPYFVQWLPLPNAPGSALCIEPGRRPRLVFRQDDDFWHVPPRAPEGYWTEHFDIAVVRSADAARAELEPWRVRGTAIGVGARTSGLFDTFDEPALLTRLDYARARKTPYEIECMAQANRIAAVGHQAAGAAFAEGISEFDLDVVYCAETAQHHANLPYSSIVALNEHAAVLHYQHLDRGAPARAHAFLIDAGAACNGYASDVTRTWPHDNALFASLVEAMDTLQQTLCSEIAPGVDFVALNERAHVLLAGVLVEHGLVKCSHEQAFALGLTRAFLPHGLGHLLGLQVHDVGGWQSAPDGGERKPPSEHPYLRLTRELEPGFAFTVEPGLYFIDSLLESLAPEARRQLDATTLDALRPCGGIRVEDNLVVESTTSRNLTREAFATLDVA